MAWILRRGRGHESAVKPEGLTFAMRKDASFIARTLIAPWSSPRASLYFKKLSTDRNSSLSLCSQTRVLSWFGFLQKQTLSLGFESKDFIWEIIPVIPIGG